MRALGPTTLRTGAAGKQYRNSPTTHSRAARSCQFAWCASVSNLNTHRGILPPGGPSARRSSVPGDRLHRHISRIVRRPGDAVATLADMVRTGGLDSCTRRRACPGAIATGERTVSHGELLVPARAHTACSAGDPDHSGTRANLTSYYHFARPRQFTRRTRSAPTATVSSFLLRHSYAISAQSPHHCTCTFYALAL